MNQSSAQKFLEALDICKSLVSYKRQPTHLTFEAIALFCEVAENPSALLHLSEEYAEETEAAFQSVYEYATNADNWRVDSELGFGVKDHCSILSFFLKLRTGEFEYFTGNFKTPEIICELLKDWKGIDLKDLIEQIPRQEINLVG